MNAYDPNYVHIPTYFLFGVKTIVINDKDKDKILILRRSEKSSRPHGWDFPGGGVDRSEDPLAATIREIKEETGLDVSQLQLLTAYLDNEGLDENKAIILGYSAHSSSENVKLSWEHESFQWVTSEELKTIDLPDLHTKIMNAYISKLGQ